MPRKTLCTIFELSQTSGLSTSTIRRLKDDNRIPYHQPSGKGGKLLFPPDAIERTSPASNAAAGRFEATCWKTTQMDE